MKKIILLMVVFSTISSTGLFSQNISNIQFINETADKDRATFSDGVHFLMLISGKNPGSFNKNINTLNKEGITEGIAIEKNSPLRRGTLALMLAKYLNLNDSLLYIIFKTERYAYRVCVAEDVMNFEGSEWDTLSGGELIEIMTKASEMTGGNE